MAFRPAKSTAMMSKRFMKRRSRECSIRELAMARTFLSA